MAGLMQDLCGRCRYFFPVDRVFPDDRGVGGRGLCRRYPPTVVVIPALHETQSFWPILSTVDGCGEFRPIDSTDDRPGSGDAG
jgi:hypothetical protein